MCKPLLLIPFVFALAACSTTHVRPTKMYQAGEKAEHNKLAYSIVDAQIFTRLGDEANARVPQNRFYIVQISVSNSGNQTSPIAPLTLVDDTGKVYPELADGTNVPRWLGVVRSVDPAQTEAGFVIFDAPSAHYKLRLTDETDEEDVFVDMPLNFLHEQMNSTTVVTPDAATPPLPTKK